jgi:hypothetical protein
MKGWELSFYLRLPFAASGTTRYGGDAACGKPTENTPFVRDGTGYAVVFHWIAIDDYSGACRNSNANSKWLKKEKV